jgi:hypothetical protein
VSKLDRSLKEVVLEINGIMTTGKLPDPDGDDDDWDLENLNPDVKSIETASGWFFETKTESGEKVTGYVRKGN